jgi:DNA-binding response OmpR family regulator
VQIVWVVTANPIDRALIVAQLSEEGFQAQGLESISDLFAHNPVTLPAALILDMGDSGLDADKWGAIRSLAPSARTILLKRAGGTAFSADLVLERPFSIGELVGKIGTLLE